jgi:hypothetical protein
MDGRDDLPEAEEESILGTGITVRGKAFRRREPHLD